MSELLAAEKLSRCKILLRKASPYFAVLTLFATYRFDSQVSLVETDGLVVRVNPDAFHSYPDDTSTALLLHVTLHAALLHPLRQSHRQPELWNIACDVMVNHIITTQTDFSAPPGTLTARDVSPTLVPVSAERVYEYLLQHRMQADQLIESASSHALPTTHTALLSSHALGNSLKSAFASKFGKAAAPTARPASGPAAPLRDIRPAAHQRSEEAMRQHWEAALLKAREQDAQRRKGSVAGSWIKELEAACTPQLDWRHLLARFVIRTPTDFTGIDRRFIHAGLYLEMLEQESVQIEIAIDTSGSISAPELAQFAAELLGILGTYPSIICHVYFCDTQVHGPCRLDARMPLPTATGGGGTDFRPFFNTLNIISHERQVDAAIYFTDGNGDFPAQAPAFPVLWVTVPGAIDSEDFPFGEVIRMV